MPAPVGALSAGRSAPAREAVHLLPSAASACRLWRGAGQQVAPRRDSPPATCRCCGAVRPARPGCPSFGLLLSGGVPGTSRAADPPAEGDTISITLTGQGKHVRLEESGYHRACMRSCSPNGEAITMTDTQHTTAPASLVPEIRPEVWADLEQRYPQAGGHRPPV